MAFALLWMISTLICCGGIPSLSGGDPSNTGARAWCCEVEEPDGTQVLECGVRERDSEHTCICMGTQILDLCMDPTHWERGTQCSRSELECY